MTIQIGQKLPSVIFKDLAEDGLHDLRSDDMFLGKKVVLFGVPGAFTPVCSAKHLPGFIQQAQAFHDKGIDSIICFSVNDPFVMQAWAKSIPSSGVVTMLSDGNGAFTRALGLELDGTPYGLGTRCQRFALVADDGVVTHLAIEKPGAFEVSDAKSVLALLR